MASFFNFKIGGFMQSDNNSNQLSGTQKRQTILFVDDQQSIHDAVSLMLCDSDYILEHAYNGEEAIEKAKSLAGKIDLLLLDLMMPDMTGVELYKQLRQEVLVGDVPVVFQTGTKDNIEIEAMVRTGKAELILKPCKKEELFTVINKLI